MVIVPRLYNRFYDLMKPRSKSFQESRKLFSEWGIAKKMAALNSSVKLQDSLYGALVFNKFREILGGRVCTMITGSVPIS